MSQHQSLKVDSVGVKHRNVFTRSERIKKMQENKRWAEGRSPFNLPKFKSIKVKVKKSASKAKPADGAAPEAGAKPAAAAKAGPAKPAAGKK